MTLAAERGSALVLVYANGVRIESLTHMHDGGEAYMGPVLRRAVAYAKTHYDSGNIVDILLSEPEMHKAALDPNTLATLGDFRHFYYVSYRWDAYAVKKTYSVKSLHLDEMLTGSGKHLVPEYACDIPRKARVLV